MVEKKRCVVCDLEFINDNKYRQVLTCGNSCARKLSWSKRDKAEIKIIKCDFCGKEKQFRMSFYKIHPQKFCSNECNRKAMDKKVDVNCNYCGINFKIRRDKVLHSNYCSKKCVSMSRIIINADYKNPEWNRSYLRLYKHHYRMPDFEINKKMNFDMKDWAFLVEKYGEKCMNCGSDKNITIDHIKPISKGGANDISNIQVLCRKCNSSKGSKDTDYRPEDLKAIHNITIHEV